MDLWGLFIWLLAAWVGGEEGKEWGWKSLQGWERNWNFLLRILPHRAGSWGGLGGRRCSWWAPEKWDLGIEGLFPLDWEDAQQNQVRDRQGASPDAGEEGTSRVKFGVSLQRAWSLPKERPCKTRLGPCCSELACSAPLRTEL